VTSSTAAVFPVAALVGACRDRGVPVLVDAAHAPGMLDVDVDGLGADFWTGNLHKWVCAPKGAAVLHAAPPWRAQLRPVVTSHGAGEGLHQEFHRTGTDDPTPWLSVPAALDVLGGLGWDRLRSHNRGLAVLGRDLLARAFHITPPVPDRATGSMATVPLPPGTVSTQEESWALGWRLFDEHRIEVPVTWWNDRAFVRISAQAYNRPADCERLAAILPGLL
jgi:isopenicillin-N epimerase